MGEAGRGGGVSYAEALAHQMQAAQWAAPGEKQEMMMEGGRDSILRALCKPRGCLKMVGALVSKQEAMCSVSL